MKSRTRNQDERGAVAIFTACLLVVLLGFSAFAVDLGMQRVARRDMQALADSVALDLARLLNGRKASDIRTGSGGMPSLEAARAASVARNDTSTLGASPDSSCATGSSSCVRAYLVALDEDGAYATDGSGIPLQVGDSVYPDAVVVVASTEVDFAFARVLGVGSGTASRPAVGTMSAPSLCFSVGTRTLLLNSDESAISPLLGAILSTNLSAVGYTGLVDLRQTYIPLADLLVSLDVGTLEEVATANIKLTELVAATVEVLKANGKTAAVEALEDLAVGVASASVTLGQILAVASGGQSSGLAVDVNVLEFLGAAIVASVAAADGSHALDIQVPGAAQVSIIEPPQIACGDVGVQARSAQIRLSVQSTIPANAGLGLVGGTLDAQVQVGRGSATLMSFGCTPETATFAVATGAVSLLAPESGDGQLHLTITAAKFLSAVPLSLLLKAAVQALGLSTVDLDVLITADAASGSGVPSVTYPSPPAMPPTTVVTGGDSVLSVEAAEVTLSTDQNALLSILTPVINAVTAALLSGVAVPIVDGVVDPLIKPIINTTLDALGIDVGVTELEMSSRPDCSAVRLAG